jgi:tripartite-type tricarboxylate transporter receptor subunit TctC
MRRAICGLLGLVLSCACLTGLQAQDADYPNKPIRIVITFAPGSGSDTIARFVGRGVGARLGQPVVVESKPGAQGSLGADYARRAPADGYTLLLGTNSTHAANVFLVRNLPYDPLRDFTPVSRVTVNPLVLVVRSELPVTSVQEFVAYVRQRPDRLNYGVGNAGGRVAVQLLQTLTGISAQDVSYPGTSQAALDLIGGRLDFMITDPSVVGPFIAQGKLRALAVTASVRLPTMPSVPTMQEAGVPGYDYASWVALYLPANAPRPVLDKLNAAIRETLDSSEAREFFGGLGMIASPSSPAELADFTRAQIELWRDLVRQARLQPL